MMYPFMTIKDDIEVTHSEIKEDNTVRVYFEKPVYLDFNSIECKLPNFEWGENHGFSEEELKYIDNFIHNVSSIILDLAKRGGFNNASNL